MKSLKTLVYTIKQAISQNAAGGNGGRHFPDMTTSDAKDIVSHTLTQLRLARSHARTTRTRNETETNFPVGVS